MCPALESFEGIVSFGGEIYPISDKIGGGALRKGSPYVPTAQCQAVLVSIHRREPVNISERKLL